MELFFSLELTSIPQAILSSSNRYFLNTLSFPFKALLQDSLLVIQHHSKADTFHRQHDLSECLSYVRFICSQNAVLSILSKPKLDYINNFCLKRKQARSSRCTSQNRNNLSLGISPFSHHSYWDRGLFKRYPNIDHRLIFSVNILL